MLSAPPAMTTSADARLDAHARVEHRLQPGAAAAVHLQARHVDREAGVERRDAAQRGGVATGVRLAEDDVVDRLGRHAGAPHQCRDHRRSQLLDRDVPEHAAEAADGGPEGLADHGLAHGGHSIRSPNTRRRPAGCGAS